MHAGGGQGDHHIAGDHALVGEDLLLIHHAHSKAGQVVVLLRHHARVLGSLAAHQGAASLHAALCHALDDLSDLLGDIAAAGDVIQKDQGLCTGADHVVDAHCHAVDADGVVLIQQHGDAQLGAHAVGAGDQHRALNTGAVQLKQAAKAAQTADALLGHRTGNVLLHQLHRAVTRRNVNAGGLVAFRIALFHGCYSPHFFSPLGRSFRCRSWISAVGWQAGLVAYSPVKQAVQKPQ